MGRKPKPTALKLLTGNPGKRPLPENEPQPKGEVVCQDFVSQDPASKRIWDQHAPTLEAQGVLTSWDVDMFGAYCRLMAEFQMEPRIFNSAKLAQMRAMASAFGLDGPKSRVQIDTGNGKKETSDPAEEFLRKHTRKF